MTMCSIVSGRALIQRVAPGPDCPSSMCSTGGADLAGGPGARCRIGLQRSLAKSREVRHPLLWHLFSYCCDLGFIAKKSEGRPCEGPTPCGPDPRPASRDTWWGCAQRVSRQVPSARRHPGRGDRWWLSRARAVFACVTVLLPCPVLSNFASFTKAPRAGSPPAALWPYQFRLAAHALGPDLVPPVPRPAAHKGQSGDPESP